MKDDKLIELLAIEFAIFLLPQKLRMYILARSCLAVSLFLLFVAAAFGPEKRVWTLKKDKEGIKVYTRPPLKGTLKDAKAECLVNDCSMEKAIALANDIENYTTWMYGVIESSLITKEDEIQHVYVVIDVPWPFQDRDLVVRIAPHELENGDIGIDIDGIADYIDEKKGRVRIPELRGYWVLSKKKQDLMVSYEASASPGGWIPDWIANLAVTDLPYESLVKMREQLQG